MFRCHYGPPFEAKQDLVRAARREIVAEVCIDQELLECT